MHNSTRRLLWLLLLTLMLLLSAACGTQPSPEEAAPAPEVESSTPETQSEAESSNQEESRNGQDIQGFLTVSNQVGAKVFEFKLLLPESWKGLFEMQQANDEAVSFVYTGSSEAKEELFTIEAMSESVWEEKQKEENAGVGIISDRGVIFVYRVTRENLYEGDEGDTFQSMIDEVPSIITSFKAKTAE